LPGVPDQERLDQLTAALLEESAAESFDRAPCGYLATLPTGRIVRVNQTFLDWTGYSREDLLGTALQQLFSVPGRIYYETQVLPLLQMQGFVREIALDLRRSTTTPLPAFVNFATRTDAAGKSLLYWIMVFDATDRRRYEQELLKARRVAELATQTERLAREQAERASRAKDDFLALVSHELKTPLSAILGWTQVLKRQAGGSADLERGLAVIERNTRLQVRLVDDLLDMSRVVSGKLRLDVQRVDLAAVLDAAIETARPAAVARELRLSVVADPNILVSGDADRLQQVFWNLLSNAVKFTPNGGSVRAIMERVNSHVEVRIIDTGQGMSADFIARAFDRFRQSGTSATQATSGLGLGLSLAKNLVEMHGGSIEAHSDGEGHGSTFIVKLPILVTYSTEAGHTEIQPRSPYAASSSERISLAGLKVMVVDDERDVREFLWHVLTANGAEVLSCESARQALASLERFAPDVLVSDIGLPGEDGYELIRQVRMLGESVSRTPALALTGLSRLEDRTRALMAGYQFHLAKPTDAQELIVTVASLAGRLSAG
jgi:PAS domain S-box-containing protein